MNNQQQPCLQRYLSVFLHEDIAYATGLAEVEGFTLQLVVEAVGSYTGSIAGKWEQ